jgi:hypothetical protein
MTRSRIQIHEYVTNRLTHWHVDAIEEDITLNADSRSAGQEIFRLV